MSAVNGTFAYDEAVAFTAAGGWRVAFVPRPESTTLALRWLVAAGGCHDGAHPGLSHLTERLVYHARAPRRRDLAAALEALGAEGVSQTTREYAGFRAVAPAAARRALLALLPDLARPPVLSRPAIVREQAALCTALVAPPPPDEALWDLLLTVLWGDHPLARRSHGTAEGIVALGPAQVAAHHEARYVPAHTVLAVAGACPLDELRAAADAIPPLDPSSLALIHASDLPPPRPVQQARRMRDSAARGAKTSTPLLPGEEQDSPYPASRGEGGPPAPRPVVGCEQPAAPLSLPSADAYPSPVSASDAPVFQGPGAHFRWLPGEVAYVAVAAPAPGMTHPDRSALRLLDYLLGRGGSARLYRDLRVRRQLVYSCSSIYMPYARAGVFAAQAVCAPALARTVAALLADSLLDLAATPPTEVELAVAQTRYAGSLHRAFETNASLAAILGVETLLAEWEPFSASAARIAAVTPAEVAAVARAYLTPARLAHATLGPLDPGTL